MYYRGTKPKTERPKPKPRPLKREKIKMKIIKVKNCEKCIYCITTGYPLYQSLYQYCSEKFRLTKEMFKIENIKKIPDWCPLEDYKGNQ